MTKKIFYPGVHIITEGTFHQKAYVIVDGTCNIVCNVILIYLLFNNLYYIFLLNDLRLLPARYMSMKETPQSGA
jgi:hypothetical protein